MSEQESQNGLLKSAQNMCKAGAVCAGISLLFGGVPLSLVGLVCVFVGRSKFSKANHAQNLSVDERLRAQRLMRISFFVALGALLLNGYAMYVMWPVMQQVLETGDISYLYSAMGAGNAAGGASGVTSTWG